MKEPKEQYKPVEKLELPKFENELPKVFQKVNCPSCQSEVKADHLNLEKSVAKCGGCNAIFSIEEEVKLVKSKNEMHHEFFRPEGIDLFFYKDELNITVQQAMNALDSIGLFFFPFLSFISTAIYLKKAPFPILIPILFALGGFYFIYKAFNYSKYKTYIDINSNQLSIRSQPKNFNKDKTISTVDIDQLYIKHHVAEGSNYASIYMIINKVSGQVHEKLITVKNLSKAKYLEQEIERYLHIENRKVLESNV